MKFGGKHSPDQLKIADSKWAWCAQIHAHTTGDTNTNLETWTIFSQFSYVIFDSVNIFLKNCYSNVRQKNFQVPDENSPHRCMPTINDISNLFSAYWNAHYARLLRSFTINLEINSTMLPNTCPPLFHKAIKCYKSIENKPIFIKNIWQVVRRMILSVAFRWGMDSITAAVEIIAVTFKR